MAGFNYQAIMTPGGLGGALGNLGGTLAQAAVERRRMEAQQADSEAQQAFRQSQLGLEGQRIGMEGQRIGLETQRNTTAEARAAAEAAHWQKMQDAAMDANRVHEAHYTAADKNAADLNDFRMAHWNNQDENQADLYDSRAGHLDALAEKARSGIPAPDAPSPALVKQIAHEAEAAAVDARKNGDATGMSAYRRVESARYQAEGFMKTPKGYRTPPPPVAPAAPSGVAPSIAPAPPATQEVPLMPPGISQGGVGPAIAPQPTPMDIPSFTSRQAGIANGVAPAFTLQDAANSEAAMLPSLKQLHDAAPAEFINQVSAIRQSDPAKYERIKAYIRGTP